MMRLLEINSVCGIKSTGRIAVDIAKEYEQKGYEVKIAYGRDEVPEECKGYAVKIGNSWDVRYHGLKSRLFDAHGLGSKRATKEFLKWASEYNPDILWLHNIHGYYINYELLFEWIRLRPDMEVKWTLHDCWAFTGHCAHFSMEGCDKWKEGCISCRLMKSYPKSLVIERSRRNYNRKQNAFCGLKKMTLITPSKWLRDLVIQSFLKNYPIEVVANKIDSDVFKPSSSDFRKKYNLAEKKIILGVASSWGKSKGLYDFYKLRERLNEDYVIILVGLQSKLIHTLPEGIIGIPHTNDAKELAEIYTAADVFVNPSKQETFGLTTLEALSCGTVAIVYENTACEEVAQANGGIVVSQDIESLYEKVIEVVC